MATAPAAAKDDEDAKRLRRTALKVSTASGNDDPTSGKALDSSLKRHTALVKRMKLSIGSDNRDQILRDIDSLALEKYVEEIVLAVVDGITRCKTEKDVWSAVEVICAMHKRFPQTFTPSLISGLSSTLSPPNRAALASLSPEQREKEETARVTRQRPALRVLAELALVGIVKDAPNRSGGETVMKTLKDLLSNDPSLSSLPLLSTFLKSYSRPFLGIDPPTATKQQTAPSTDSAQVAAEPAADGAPGPLPENEELVEKDIRDRFKKMCEGYFDTVSKKLVKEHERLQEQDRRNHEAYIRSGEIFEDRQQTYEKMIKSYEKLLSNCQTLADLLYLSLPKLSTSSQKSDSILLLDGSMPRADDREDITGGIWQDDEERRFYEDLTDLKDFIPKSVLGVDEDPVSAEESSQSKEEEEKKAKEIEAEAERELQRLEAEMQATPAGKLPEDSDIQGEDEEPGDDEGDVTPKPTPPRTPSPTLANSSAPGPSQLLTALLARLPDATNRSLIDQAAIDFAFLNSKAARKRLVKFLGQVPKGRTDLLPYYARLVGILNPYMPDIGSELVSVLEEEFRYLQRKKNVVKELADVRRKNGTYISELTKFSVVPTHLILHIFKVYVDDFSGVNIDNIAMLMEGCGRFLLRSEATASKMRALIELMRRKQSLTHLDQRQILVLENAYYQCNPPERGPRVEKERSPMVLFIRHLIFDVLVKKTIDKVLKLIRKLDWDDVEVNTTLHKLFTRPWKLRYANVGLMAMLTYDLQRYHPSFSVTVVDQVLEDIRLGLEQNIYKNNQRRIASIRYLGELYIYRMVSSTLIFDTLWSLATFSHPEGRPMPGQISPIDAPDDFFRVRLVCVLLDGCGMCFDRGSLRRKLDAFLTFFQLYILCKNELPMDVDFMLTDTLEALRPDLVKFKTFEEAAVAVDELFAAGLERSGAAGADGDDSGGEDSDDDERREEADEEDGPPGEDEGAIDRPSSPDTLVLLSSKPKENTGPTEEDNADFAKELAKMMTDSSLESRKVDKKAAMAMWDSAVIPGTSRRRDDTEGAAGGASSNNGQDVMKFTMLSRRGNKQQARQLPIPKSSALAMHTRSAQIQDQAERQHLKKLVLDYEQREEAEEMGAQIEALRNKGIRVRYANP